ncbi:GerMN domain-containing protein [Oscillatoria sp. FACHB-1406]|uniref:GerMN domain-containing protein n=1 Tax=Oscillatoria sp. FACHB-1406 TaxID=2692846 RepID=UPI001689B04D|nr:GerMN domain-containing protein [Oscillatoria sp. FACHB-1406]MBD2580109.1 GerMN domain-containing protein [Oscillatoria sp. FACHB-1406]
MIKPNLKPSLHLLVGLFAVILAGCDATTTESTNSVSPTPSPTATTVLPSPSPSIVPASPSPVARPTPPKPPVQATKTSQQAGAKVFWLDANAQTVKPVPSPVEGSAPKNAAESEAALNRAFQALLAGPKTAAQSSSIPKGTRLLGLKQVPDGVNVNLSEDFTKGGGTMSMTGRLAQVIYTATSLNPQGKVWIEVEGNRLNVLGGEGLVLEQPLTRQKFERDFGL